MLRTVSYVSLVKRKGDYYFASALREVHKERTADCVTVAVQLLAKNFAAMQRLGDPVLKPFLQVGSYTDFKRDTFSCFSAHAHLQLQGRIVQRSIQLKSTICNA